MSRKLLLVVAHAPSPNTARLRDALLEGIAGAAAEQLELRCLTPFDAGPDEVRAASGILLSTPENLGYMSGALKDFFDRIYYPCLELTQGLPYALQVRAGNDGSGTVRAVESIATGLRWRRVQDALVCRGEYREEWGQQCRELGAAFALGLDAGIL
ncbi:MAG TPA: flavodoxin [Solimonas sp.]|nr:flavodoxin [Solimonas sp.]